MYSSVEWAGQARRYVTMADTCLPHKCPFPWGIWTPYEPIWVNHPNSISIGSAVFVQLTRVPNTHRQTRRHTAYCYICRICSDRLYPRTACRRSGLIIVVTRKHRQSFRHADPRRQRPQVAQGYRIPAVVTRNRATVTVFITVWPWPFDLWVNACWATAIMYTCTKFGVNSSSRFPVRARTNRQTNKHTHTHRRDWTP